MMVSFGVIFLNGSNCSPLYRARNILTVRGHGFDWELHSSVEKPFTFSSVITNNSLRPLWSSQSTDPLLSKPPLPPRCIPDGPLVCACHLRIACTARLRSELLLPGSAGLSRDYVKAFARSELPNHPPKITAALYVFLLVFKQELWCCEKSDSSFLPSAPGTSNFLKLSFTRLAGGPQFSPLTRRGLSCTHGQILHTGCKRLGPARAAPRCDLPPQRRDAAARAGRGHRERPVPNFGAEVEDRQGGGGRGARC